MTSELVARRERAKKTVHQFLKFGIVGGSGVVVNLVVAFILNLAHGGSDKASEILFPLMFGFNFRYSSFVWIAGFLVAVVANYQLNRVWTFKSGRHLSWWKEFWPFFVVGSAAALVGFFLKIAMVNPTSMFYLPEPLFMDRGLRSRELWAHLFAIILTIPINFLINKFWTFRAIRVTDGEEIPMVAPVVAPEVVDPDGEVEELELAMLAPAEG